MDRLLELELESISTGLITSARHWNKPVVVFNSASKCGFTHQLAEFQKLYEQGQIVPIALPTNEFGSQEPGDNAEIRQYACKVYNVKFPICIKTDLNHKFFKTYGEPAWNFNKYLFDKNHKFVKMFDSNFKPRYLLDHV